MVLPDQQTLPDGTVVELKDGARIDVRFGSERSDVRRVFLENGEAHFAVAKDPTRPFIVTVAGVEVRAVGTAFAVGLDQREIAVLVTEGQVAVERTIAPPAGVAVERSGVTLDAGKRLVVDLAAANVELPAPESIAAIELAAHLSWRAPRIRFSNTPLFEAVAIFNQRNSEKLVIDEALAELRIGGVVRADNTRTFLIFLKNEFGIEPTAGPGGTIQLRRR
ncbi:MAG: FecR domain-containing protein [Verrucomicrobia bacterium]|nr:FecR domain-containing protein [Verrucomicrobiota bacterium]